MYGGCYPGGQPMMMIPVMPPKKRHAPCPEDDGTTRITAQMAAQFFEEFNKEGDCKLVNAEINGQEYQIKLSTGSSKKKRKSSSSEKSGKKGSSKNDLKGPTVQLCDCDVPMPQNLSKPGNDEQDKKAAEREERINKNLALCMKMMRQLFIQNYDKQQQEDESTVRMVEIPVMVVPPAMGGMGMGMPAMGMGMPGMGMPGMPGGGCNCG